ncbi:exodeoxyribonuclease V subunit alpha [Buchnera aphidicola]|uniref:exodeoxyribonuclease V subunit alpha n=1 Tax=Buchnera aphidicola TaxID=9 RepID=UPI003D18F5F7
MKKLLKKLAHKKIIRYIDFYFACLISKKNPGLMLASVCVSNTVKDGNSCLLIETLSKKNFFRIKNKIINKIWKKTNYIKNWNIFLLKNTDIVSDGRKNTPLVLLNKKLYIRKYWLYENKIANFFCENSYFIPCNLKKLKNILNNSSKNKEINHQKIAITMSILCKQLFIMGGAGTGKTKIIFEILMTFIKMYKNKLVIKLAATTGKAAYNLRTFIKKKNIKKKNKIIEKIEVHTLHKMLKINILNFPNKKNKKINADVLIIDESSMIDINTMIVLINSLYKKTRIIFVGDPNQIRPVGVGNILKDIYHYYFSYNYSFIFHNFIYKILGYNIKYKKINNSPIKDNICLLNKNYRFNKNLEIYNFSEKIKKKKINNLLLKKYKHIKFISIKSYIDYKKIIKIIFKIVNQYLEYFVNNKKNLSKVMYFFNKNKIICTTNKSYYGVNNINKIIDKLIKKKRKQKIFVYNKEIWYQGKPIMIKKNNYNLMLNNGDIGIVQYDKKMEWHVSFFIDGKINKIPLYLIKNYKTSWAITTHKSQGSEFDRVFFILPENIGKLLTNEIIYTAITRAKKKINIYGNKKIFLKSIYNDLDTNNGLTEKIDFYKKKLVAGVGFEPTTFGL